MALNASKTVSKNRSFKKISEEQMAELKQNQLKKRTFAKVQWAVRAFQEWRSHRLADFVNYDPLIFECNLENLENLQVNVLDHALCRFIPEVTKVDGGEYPGKTLYEMVLSIQKFLNEYGLNYKLIDGPEFKNVKIVLDNVMKQRAAENIGMVKKQA